MLTLRPLRLEDESAALAAHEALKADAFSFLLGYEDDGSWATHIARRNANQRGQDIGEDWVPATFLGAFVNGQLVGRASVRHELNDWLAAYGGHVGYCVHPAHRRRGYATEILRQAVIVARSVGVDGVLVMCHDTNLASARVIEANGGVLEAVVTGEDETSLERQYWIR